MCRNITTLRGLEPAATDEEIEAAARQFVRKVTGVQSVSAATAGPVDHAVEEIAAIVTRLLDELPDRRRPPATVPPLRRPEVRARLGLGEFPDPDHDHVHGAGQAAEHGHGAGDGHTHGHVDGHAHAHEDAHVH